jgi:hypothetical protein
MKKIFTFFISTFMVLNLAACSSNNNDYALEFFSALDNTLELNSGHIQGTSHQTMKTLLKSSLIYN